MDDDRPTPATTIPAREWHSLQGMMRALVTRCLNLECSLIGLKRIADGEATEPLQVVFTEADMVSAFDPGLCIAVDYANGKTSDGGMTLRPYRDKDQQVHG